MTKRIEKRLAARIEERLRAGKALADGGETLEAWKAYVEALELVPEPKPQWRVTTEILTSIGDVAFRRGKYAKALDALSDAVRCPNGLGNVFIHIHLRKGQCHFELGDMKRAADDLTRAYLGGGREAFANGDPKCFRLLEQVLKPPRGQDRL